MTNLSTEDRLQLVYELFLVVGNHPKVLEADAPKRDTFSLSNAIIRGETFPISSNQTLLRVIKKSPVWEKIKPFLRCIDSECASKGCKHSSYWHTDKNGCEKSNYRITPSPRCGCRKFIQKVF